MAVSQPTKTETVAEFQECKVTNTPDPMPTTIMEDWPTAAPIPNPFHVQNQALVEELDAKHKECLELYAVLNDTDMADDKRLHMDRHTENLRVISGRFMQPLNRPNYNPAFNPIHPIVMNSLRYVIGQTKLDKLDRHLAFNTIAMVDWRYASLETFQSMEKIFDTVAFIATGAEDIDRFNMLRPMLLDEPLIQHFYELVSLAILENEIFDLEMAVESVEDLWDSKHVLYSTYR